MKQRALIHATGIALALAMGSASAQVCQTDTIEATTSPEQFIINGDGTVTDASTGLMWTQCSLGQVSADGACNNVASSVSWQNALQGAKSFNQNGGLGGYADWRVPTIKELGSLVEFQCHSPAIDLTVFPDTPAGAYWSATPDARSEHQARSIYFVNGSDITPDVSSQRYVRLVRTASN